jgi:hypothetical protein
MLSINHCSGKTMYRMYFMRTEFQNNTAWQTLTCLADSAKIMSMAFKIIISGEHKIIFPLYDIDRLTLVEFSL